MMFDIRKLILERAVKEMQDGMCVNLGIGMPTLIADMIPSDFNVMLQSRRSYARRSEGKNRSKF